VYGICSSWQGLIHQITTKWLVSPFCILFAVIQLQVFLHGCLLMLSINYDLCYPKWGWKQSSRFKKVKDVQDHNESVISSQTRDAVFWAGLVLTTKHRTVPWIMGYWCWRQSIPSALWHVMRFGAKIKVSNLINKQEYQFLR